AERIRHVRRSGIARQEYIACGDHAEEPSHFPIAIAIERRYHNRARAKLAHPLDHWRGRARGEYYRRDPACKQRIAERGEALDWPIARRAARDERERHAPPLRGRARRAQVGLALPPLRVAQLDARQRRAHL